jgi:hypothetical protein
MKSTVYFLLVLLLLVFNQLLVAQVIFVGDTLVYRFDGWTGVGFAPEGSTSRIDSRSWIINGLTDGSMDFGDTKLGGDFGRGLSSGRVTTGGVYAFTPAADVRLLGFQPTGTDLAPGSATWRVLIPDRIATKGVVVEYDLWVYNDQDRSTLIELEWSRDGVIFQPTNGGGTLTPAAAFVGVQWRKHSVSGYINTNDIEPNSYLYVRWLMRDGAGSGSRDEWGLEEIRMYAEMDSDIGPPNPVSTLLEFNFDEDTDIPSQRSVDQFDARFSLAGANRIGFLTGSPGRAANSNGWMQTNSAWYVKLSTIGFEGLAVQSKQYSSPSGPKLFNLEWSSDSLSWKFLSTVEVGGTFVNIQPGRGTPLPEEANNKPRIWIRWRLASDVSVSGGSISSSGTSRIDEISITGNPTPPVLPILSTVQMDDNADYIIGFAELSSNGSALVNNIELKCHQVDGDSIVVIALPIKVRTKVNISVGPLPQPSKWACAVAATSAVGTSTSPLYQVSIDPPPPPYADKPTIQARNIQLIARTDTSIHIRWERGNGEFSMLAIVPHAEMACLTDTSVTYSANPNQNYADTTRNGCKVVLSGTGNEAVVFGFYPLQNEVFTVLEYNGQPGRENYLEDVQERAEFKTRAKVPSPLEYFKPLLVTDDRAVFAWNQPSIGSVLVLLVDEVPSMGALVDYLDGKSISGSIVSAGCYSEPCTLMRDAIAEKKVVALVVNGPSGHQSPQNLPYLIWEPTWPDPSVGRLLAEWNFDAQLNDPSWSIWEHQATTVEVVGARDRGYVSGYSGLASYTDQWNEPNLTKSWKIALTTHGLVSASIEFRIISSASGPARFRVACDVFGTVYNAEQIIFASASWSTSTVKNVEIPSACLGQPNVKLLITPDGNVAINGNSISRSGTSRIDDIRLYGKYDSKIEPLMGKLKLKTNYDHGVVIEGTWISAAGMLPSRQSVKVVGPQNEVEIMYHVSDKSKVFELKNLQESTRYSLFHCGYLENTASCSDPLWLSTPYKVPDAPTVISYNIVGPDSIDLTGYTAENDIHFIMSGIDTDAPVLVDSLGVEQQKLPGFKVTARHPSRQLHGIGGLRPGASYRFWAVAVSGPDSLARYSRPPHPYVAVTLPRLVEAALPDIIVSTVKRDFQTVRFDVTSSGSVKKLFTITRHEFEPTQPSEDESYTHGQTYSQGNQIGMHTYVVGNLVQGELRVDGLPLGTKWRLRMYSVNELNGAITYSKGYFEHIFETLSDPFVKPLTVEQVWFTSVGDTVSTTGTLLWKSGETLLVQLQGGNLMVSTVGEMSQKWDLYQKVGLLGVRSRDGLDLVTFTLSGIKDEDVIKPYHLHPDTTNHSAMRRVRIVVGNLLETEQQCFDGRPAYRQRGVNSRKVCLIVNSIPPQKGSFPNEWAVVGYPLFDSDTSLLKLLVVSDKDISAYAPPQAVLALPNKDQIMTWTSADETEVEFKWDYKAAIRPYDYFPDSVAANAHFITRTRTGRVVIDRKLENESRSLSIKTRDLHRLHTDADSLQLSVDLEWTVALFNKNDPKAREMGSLEWVPFRLLRLTALNVTDVMDIPGTFKLDPARPNPFNPSTTFRVYVPSTEELDIQMYDILGRSVKRIYAGQMRAGVHDINVDASRLPSGVYILLARYGGVMASQRVTLIK